MREKNTAAWGGNGQGAGSHGIRYIGSGTLEQEGQDDGERGNGSSGKEGRGKGK